MPKIYEAIRDRLRKQGVPLDQAKTSAAKIYNSKRRSNRSLPKLNPQHKQRQ